MLVQSKFRPAWWLRNSHLQTLWAARLLPVADVQCRRERLTTPDNDFINVAWSDKPGGRGIVAIFHGLTGSLQSPYASNTFSRLQEHGFSTAFMHFRGCSGEPNRKAMSYHSGQTQDIEFFINTIRERYPDTPISAVGFSLGANALLKYLATCTSTPLDFAMAICPPLLLQQGAQRLDTGVSRLYQRVLLDQLKQSIEKKIQAYPQLHNQFPRNFHQLNNFYDFDDAITAPLHGFNGVNDYYQKASTLDDLAHIETPTHIIFARDDPFFSQACIPTNEQLHRNVCFELAEHGGHVGFVHGAFPWKARSWLPHRVSDLLQHRAAQAGVH